MGRLFTQQRELACGTLLTPMSFVLPLAYSDSMAAHTSQSSGPNPPR